jgi:uncharacterized protein (DUF1810 family)
MIDCGMDDPFDLQRFVGAQASAYDGALAELRAGRKTSHWIWYVFPQLRALGRSSRATYYGIASGDEARAYLAHPVLGARLTECVSAMNAHRGQSAADILGAVDAMKFRSCLTLFLAVDPANAVLRTALESFFEGVPDPATLTLLGRA